MNNSPYQQRLEKNTRAFKWFVLVLTVAFVACWVIYALHQVGSQPQPSVEEQLNDTLIEGHQNVDGTVPLLLERRHKR